MAVSVSDVFPRTKKTTITHVLENGKRDPEVICQLPDLECLQLMYCTYDGSEAEICALKQFKSIVDELLPGMRRRSHTHTLIFREKINASLIAKTRDDVVVGGVTFRLMALSTNYIVLEILIIAVQPDFSRAGIGSMLISAVNNFGFQFGAKMKSQQVFLLTQVDDTEVAIRFWRKQGLEDTELAEALCEHLTVQENHYRLYEHSIPMVKLLANTSISEPQQCPYCSEAVPSKLHLNLHVRFVHEGHENTKASPDSAVSVHTDDVHPAKRVKKSVWNDLFAVRADQKPKHTNTLCVDNVVSFLEALKSASKGHANQAQTVTLLTATQLNPDDRPLLRLIVSEGALPLYISLLKSSCGGWSGPQALALQVQIIQHLNILKPHVSASHLLQAENICVFLAHLATQPSLPETERQTLNAIVAQWAALVLSLPERSQTTVYHESSQPSSAHTISPPPPPPPPHDFSANPAGSSDAVQSVRKALRPLVKHYLKPLYKRQKITAERFKTIAKQTTERYAKYIKLEGLSSLCFQDAFALPNSFKAEVEEYIRGLVEKSG